jgi:hypothetical protein
MPEERTLADLEAALRRIAGAESYPPVPPLAAAVRRRIEATASPPPRRPRLLPAMGVGAAVLLVLMAFALALAVPSATRDAIADFFGLERIELFGLDAEPDSDTPSEIVGTPTTLAEARRAADFDVRVPTYPNGISDPDRVLIEELEGGIRVFLIYERSDISFDLMETTGSISKGLSFEASVEPVPFAESSALWLRGQRVVLALDEDGTPLEESRRVTDANTLVWESDGLLLRLEGNLTLNQALAIASSVAQQDAP